MYAMAAAIEREAERIETGADASAAAAEPRATPSAAAADGMPHGDAPGEPAIVHPAWVGRPWAGADQILSVFGFFGSITTDGLGGYSDAGGVGPALDRIVGPDPAGPATTHPGTHAPAAWAGS